MNPDAPTTRLSLAHRFEVWWQFTLRAVEMRHRGSYLGMLWTVLNPLLMLGLYVVVFSFIFNNRFNVLPGETRLDYALGVFVGLALFHVFSETLASSPALIVNNPNLVKKVVFPLELLPLSNVAALWFHALVTFALLIAAAAATGRIAGEGLLWLLPILAPHILLCIGTAWILSAVGVFFRDIGQVTGFATQVVMYASAIFFSAASVKAWPGLWAVVKWNPLLHTVEAMRSTLLWGTPIELPWLAYTWACGIAAAGIGWLVFKRTRHAFADVL